MGIRELLIEIRRLSMNERIVLIETLVHDLREEMQSQTTLSSSLERAYGLLSTDTTPPTDEEIKEIIADHLMEKHS
jgi:hypothetical protein